MILLCPCYHQATACVIRWDQSGIWTYQPRKALTTHLHNDSMFPRNARPAGQLLVPATCAAASPPQAVQPLNMIIILACYAACKCVHFFFMMNILACYSTCTMRTLLYATAISTPRELVLVLAVIAERWKNTVYTPVMHVHVGQHTYCMWPRHVAQACSPGMKPRH